jgi:serine phosphatase RsbU (regulator of sigma subunit)
MTSATTEPTSPDATREPIELRCMEIWGGNEATQRSLKVTGIDAWVYSQPVGGEAAGGDLHYVSACGAGRVARFVVADVAGHGEEVDSLGRTLRHLVRKHINELDQARFAQTLNQAFSDLGHDGRFATALLTTYYAPTDHLLVVNAGHPRPLWYRADRAFWETLAHDCPERETAVMNLPLGVIGDTGYHQFAVQLASDDLVLMYTDSLTEAKNADGELLGEQGLLRLVEGLATGGPERLCRHLLQRIEDWRGGRPAEDDLTLMVLHHNGDDPGPMPLSLKLSAMAKMLGLKKV